MKKKILFGLLAGIFIVALTLNFNFIQGNNNGTTLESVTIMAEAYAYDPCPGWDGSPFYGWDPAIEDCRIVNFCTSTCI